jgi:DNA-binding winged helix-turn-helix (wHTH) protein
MAGQEISKKNPSVYRFGEFELQPEERVLKRAGQPVALAPKAFDALLYLLRNAEHLVGKDELMRELWPATYVSEANLTNIVAAIRKILGTEAIQTVSKYGYRFRLAIHAEPGVAADVYARFLRANQLTAKKSLEAMAEARELYLVCVAEDPDFAPAWAWLGRCCWFLGKFDARDGANVELAAAAFRRALLLDPDSACAHQFITPMQADRGEALEALQRLRRRVGRHPQEAESHAGLAQVLRFCGLLDESVEAAIRATRLDPAIATSLPHSLFLRGDYAAAIEAHSGKTGYYLDAAAWAAIGEHRHVQKLLRERLQGRQLSDLMGGLMESLWAIAEHRFEDARTRMEAMRVRNEPEALVYLARHYSYIGDVERAIELVGCAARAGFVCCPSTLRSDPWFIAVRKHAGFDDLLAEMQRFANRAREAWLGAS